VRHAISKAVLAVVVVAAGSVEPLGAATGWVRPVPGPVTRGFDPPPAPYAAGHRGVDFAAGDGAIVVAIGDGVVEFAGRVAYANHVVVRHDNGWRTSVSYVRDIVVREGERVAAGTPIARCCSSADPSHGMHGPAIHVALRIGDDYADPLSLFSPPDLTELVHLAPADGREWPASRRSAIQMVFDVTGFAALVDAGAAFVGVGNDLLDVFGVVLEAGADHLPELLRYLDEIDPSPLSDLAEATQTWIDQRDECDADPPEPGSVHQQNRLMFVAGIDSFTRPDGTTNGFPADDLGYQPDDINWFSYAADGGDYERADTYAPIDESARRLGEQLRALQRAWPGRSVDLIAHSQGGVVVQTFLKFHYDPGDPTLPPIGTVVTLSAPHAGAPLATSGAAIAQRPFGPWLIDHTPGAQPSSAASPRDLAETSALQDRLRVSPLPVGLEVVSIGTPFDLIVPATSTRLDGASHVIVDPGGVLDQHTRVTTSRATQVVVNNALLGRPAPCVSYATALAAAYVPERVAFIERAPGVLARSGFSMLG
jgi:Peptidase family M23